MEYLEQIENNRAEMLQTLKELIAIKSVQEPEVTAAPDEGGAPIFMPFGKGVHGAFSYMLKKAGEEGFDVQNIDNYGGHIEFGGYTCNDEGEIIATSEEVMGILGHLDVVPEGGDWDYDPYGGTIADGKIFGRGTADDKGPVIAAFYAMKALKDVGIVPEKKVRLILGLDEETNWKGMEYYFSKCREPDFGFTPDSEFPAIHGEKGIIVFDIAKKMAKTVGKGLELRTFKGGAAANMVADHARVVLRAEKVEDYEPIKKLISTYRSDKCLGERSAKINCKGVGKSLEITVQGISSHGARPDSGINAISTMMEFLGQLVFINEDINDFIEFYNKHIGFEFNGKSLGCGLSDEPSGELTLNVGMIDLDSRAVRLTINVRYPVTFNDTIVYEAIMPVMNKYNLGIIKGKHQEPIYIPSDDPMIVTLMDIYKEHTGDADSKPLVIGGGTYARAAKNVIAFGPSFPGEREVAHQKNEYIDIENLMTATKIYADAIFRLTKCEV